VTITDDVTHQPIADK